MREFAERRGREKTEGGMFNIQYSTSKIQAPREWLRLPLMVALLAGGALARADEPETLALRLGAEGRRRDAAVEYRRLALSEGEAVRAGGWYWFAANEYSQGGDVDLSEKMLDRAEDLAPFALGMPTTWLRAENAMRERNWPSAAFHFESLERRAGDDAMREFAARGAAAAYLRDRDPASARTALRTVPEGAAGEARAAIDRWAGGKDKKPWVGGVLGLVPGLGYAYSGEYANALRSLILNGLFIWGMAEAAEEEQWGIFAVVAFGEITWYTGSIYGGTDAAHRHNRRRLENAASEVRGARRPQVDLSGIPLATLRFEF
jgi:hypothetical protein